MRRFADLYARLDSTTSTLEKVAAIRDYLHGAPAADAAWAVWFLTGRRMKGLMAGARLREWATEVTGLPDWLVEDAYSAVGDQAETVALLLDAHGMPHAPRSVDRTAVPDADAPLATWAERFVRPLKGLDDDTRRARLVAAWSVLLGEPATDERERTAAAAGDDHVPAAPPRPDRDRLRALFVLHKLLTGALRVGVSRGLVERAVAEAAGVPRPVVAHRLMGGFEPGPETWERIVSPRTDDADRARPYPFFLASPLEASPDALGDPGDWHAEWKWDGIRAQLVRRGGETYLWSRGEELITERFPEIAKPAAGLPDGTVLDGEVLAWRNGMPLPFAVLQTRIGRKNLTPAVRADAPVVFMAYDQIEAHGDDVRAEPQDLRRVLVEQTVSELGAETFLVSPLVEFASWDELAQLRGESRARRAEGFMLKQRHGVYGVGRQRGAWWKWKIEPLTLDAVLVYAQAGHGRRSNLHTDYTLAVWDGDALVPVAKAYSGLTDRELGRMDRWIRRNTTERFGPVRAVPPEHVFEIAFENIARSKRHKSGIALRFPRIARWRTDKRPKDADTLADVHALLEIAEGAWSDRPDAGEARR